MRRTDFTGFARCAHRNAVRMEELLPEVTAVIAQQRAAIEADFKTQIEAFQQQGKDPTGLTNLTIRIPTPVENEMEECAVSVIVMSHMAAEAYIYDFAARELGDDLASELEQLRPVGKWRVIPRLARGHMLKTDGAACGGLKALTALRNRFAHPKSKEVSDPEAPASVRTEIDTVRGAREALKTLKWLQTEAEQFDETGAPELLLSDLKTGLALSKKTRERIEAELAAEREQKRGE